MSSLAGAGSEIPSDGQYWVKLRLRAVQVNTDAGTSVEAGMSEGIITTGTRAARRRNHWSVINKF